MGSRYALHELQVLDALNGASTPIEHVMRLRALQELSVFETELLLKIVTMVSALDQQGALETKVQRQIDLITEDRCSKYRYGGGGAAEHRTKRTLQQRSQHEHLLREHSADLRAKSVALLSISHALRKRQDFSELGNLSEFADRPTRSYG